MRYEIEPVTASPGFDYEGNSGILAWSRDNFHSRFSIPIIRDLTDELTNSETFIVRLTDPQGDVFLGDNVTATVTITDSDDPILRFEGPERVSEPNNLGGIGIPDPTPTRAFGENYRLSVINSHGDLVTVGDGFDIRWAPNLASPPPGKSHATLGTDYNLTCANCPRTILPGVIYDNVDLAHSGTVIYDTTHEKRGDCAYSHTAIQYRT